MPTDAIEECCFVCDQPTGRAGYSDDSINFAGSGPWCPSCADTLREEILHDVGIDADSVAQIGALRQRVAELEHERDGLVATVRAIASVNPFYYPSSKPVVEMAREALRAHEVDDDGK